MSLVFTVLLWLSLFFLVWGVISPDDLYKYSGKLFNRRRSALVFGALSIVMFVMVSITAPQQSSFPITFRPGPSTAVVAAQDKGLSVNPDAKITTKTVTETETIPFAVSAIQDATIPKGSEKVSSMGAVGQRLITYVVTYADGNQIDKQMVSKVISKQPINQVTLVGTKVSQTPATPVKSPLCSPDYSGACVPLDASDVDCDGHGNGPVYVKGTFLVIGDDTYNLDRDEDGTACNEWN